MSNTLQKIKILFIIKIFTSFFFFFECHKVSASEADISLMWPGHHPPSNYSSVMSLYKISLFNFLKRMELFPVLTHEH